MKTITLSDELAETVIDDLQRVISGHSFMLNIIGDGPNKDAPHAVRYRKEVEEAKAILDEFGVAHDPA